MVKPTKPVITEPELFIHKFNIMSYLPILIGIVALVICYFLYKKLKTLSENYNSSKIEKHLKQFIEHQSTLNKNINKKMDESFSYFQDNLNNIENKINSNNGDDFFNSIKPESKLEPKFESKPIIQSELVTDNEQSQPIQRELMPNSVFQNAIKIESNLDDSILLKPTSNVNKKKTNLNNVVFNEQVNQSNNNTKKVISIDNNDSKLFLEEDSSEEENEN